MSSVIIAKRNFHQTFLGHKTLSILYTSTVTIQKRYLTKQKATRRMKRKGRLSSVNVKNVAICKCLMLRYNYVLLMKGKQCSLHALNANLRNLKTHNLNGILLFFISFDLSGFIAQSALHIKVFLSIVNANTIKRCPLFYYLSLSCSASCDSSLSSSSSESSSLIS